MFLKSLILLTCCLALTVAAPPQNLENVANQLPDITKIKEPWILVRNIRSPDDGQEKNGGGNVGITYEDDSRTGRTASVYANQNLYTSDDGRFQVEAQAQASRNFDYNRNDYGGFIKGRWSF